MGIKRRANCQICSKIESRYTCPHCAIVYCSVACFKEHELVSICSRRPDEKAESVDSRVPEAGSSTTLELEISQGKEFCNGDLMERLSESDVQLMQGDSVRQSGDPFDSTSHFAPETKLRKLSSLKWPYIPDSATTAFPDPLTRDDPRTLTMPQYEAIARSPSIRKALADHPSLHRILKAIDAQRGEDRENSLQRVLGVSTSQATGFSLAHTRDAPYQPVVITAEDGNRVVAGNEDTKALRVLAEAIEGAIRTADGRTTGLIGLDWQDTEN